MKQPIQQQIDILVYGITCIWCIICLEKQNGLHTVLHWVIPQNWEARPRLSVDILDYDHRMAAGQNPVFGIILTHNHIIRLDPHGLYRPAKRSGRFRAHWDDKPGTVSHDYGHYQPLAIPLIFQNDPPLKRWMWVIFEWDILKWTAVIINYKCLATACNLLTTSNA